MKEDSRGVKAVSIGIVAREVSSAAKAASEATAVREASKGVKAVSIGIAVREVSNAVKAVLEEIVAREGFQQP